MRSQNTGKLRNEASKTPTVGVLFCFSKENKVQEKEMKRKNGHEREIEGIK